MLINHWFYYLVLLSLNSQICTHYQLLKTQKLDPQPFEGQHLGGLSDQHWHSKRTRRHNQERTKRQKVTVTVCRVLQCRRTKQPTWHLLRLVAPHVFGCLWQLRMPSDLKTCSQSASWGQNKPKFHILICRSTVQVSNAQKYVFKKRFKTWNESNQNL